MKQVATSVERTAVAHDSPEPAASAAPPAPRASPWEFPQYRLLLVLWLAANLSMSMHEATSAWLMASLGASAFVDLMQESRRSRLRAGASSWALFRDPANPERHVEQWVAESWFELLRHRDRLTVSERELRDAKRAFHVGPEPPAMSFLIAEDIARRKPDQGSTTM